MSRSLNRLHVSKQPYRLLQCCPADEHTALSTARDYLPECGVSLIRSIQQDQELMLSRAARESGTGLGSMVRRIIQPPRDRRRKRAVTPGLGRSLRVLPKDSLMGSGSILPSIPELRRGIAHGRSQILEKTEQQDRRRTSGLGTGKWDLCRLVPREEVRKGYSSCQEVSPEDGTVRRRVVSKYLFSSAAGFVRGVRTTPRSRMMSKRIIADRITRPKVVRSAIQESMRFTVKRAGDD